MADSFIKVPFTSDADTLADRAVDRLRVEWPGWEPNDGDMEVVQIEALAPMAQNAVETAVPPAAFRAILERLHGVLRLAGTPATTTVTLLFADADPHTVDAGYEVQIDGVAFTTDTAATGTSPLAAVPVTATVIGTVANDLPGDVVAPGGALAFVSDITVDTPTTGGTDPEDDDDYQDRGSRELELQAKTLVTTRDYELDAIDQPGIGRAVATANTTTRTMTVTVTGEDGHAAASGDKTALAASFEEFRLSNWTVAIADPTYTTINVTYTVKAYPGFDAVDLEARVDAALAAALDPAASGRPRSFADTSEVTTRWVIDPKIRRNKLIDAIGDVDGVDYVDTLTLSGSAGSADTDGNWNMPGTVPLPLPGTFTGTVT
jgi:hypothetical protein